MAAPTLISTTQSTNFNALNATKDTPSVSWNSGDLVTVWGFTGDNGDTLTNPAVTGLTLTNRITSNVASRCKLYLWTATAGSSGSSTFTGTMNAANRGGYVVKVYRGSGGFGNISSVGSGTTGGPNVSLTMTATDSVTDGGWGDWNGATGARTYRTTNLGTATEDQYLNNATYATTASWHNAASTASGAQTTGLTAPSCTAWLCASIEILGAGGTPISVTLTPATETDAAQALSFVKPIVVTLTPATESDAAQALSVTHPIIVTLTPAAETDTAQGISAAHVIPVVPATETDAAVGLSTAKSVSLTPAVETDTAQGLVVTKTIFKSLTPAVETDAAQGLSFSLAGAQHITLVPATETDVAVPIVFSVVGGGLANRKRYYIQRTGHGVRRRIG